MIARIVARCIDLAVMVFIMAFFSALPTPGDLVHLVVWLTGLALALGYRLLGDAQFRSQAVGKRLLGVRVVDATTRQPCSRVGKGRHLP